MARALKLAAQTVSVGLVVALLAVLVVRVVRDDGSRLTADLERGKRPAAPNFSLPRLDGPGELELASLRGKAVILNFWASWCIPCKDEAPRLERAYRRWRSRGLVVVGVNGSDDFSRDARRFTRRFGLTYPQVRDRRYSLVRPYGISGYPETFFVGRTGKVVEKVTGPLEQEELDEYIRLVLRS